MKTINVNCKDRILTVSWQHETLFNEIIKLQRSVLFTKGDEHRLSFELTESIPHNVELFFNNLWSKAIAEECYDNLPLNPVVLDIGSGIGIMDVLAYKYLNNTGEFYLLDKSEKTYNISHNVDFYHSMDHGFYNSRLVTADVLKNSGCGNDAFKLINPDDEWPDQIDLITSWASYCWHYPLDAYWDRVKKHLKVGGKFAIEILKSADDKDSIIKTISEEFKSEPKVQDMADMNSPKGGYRCIWIRNHG